MLQMLVMDGEDVQSSGHERLATDVHNEPGVNS